MTAYEIISIFIGILALLMSFGSLIVFFSYIFQSPGNVMHNMKFINDDSGIWEICESHVAVNVIHMHNKILNVFPVRKRTQVRCNFCLCAGRQNG